MRTSLGLGSLAVLVDPDGRRHGAAIIERQLALAHGRAPDVVLPLVGKRKRSRSDDEQAELPLAAAKRRPVLEPTTAARIAISSREAIANPWLCQTSADPGNPA